MPLRKMHHTLINLLKRELDDFVEIEFIFGCEVGVWKGETSKVLLEAFPELQLLMVDRYELYSPGGKGELSRIDSQVGMWEGMKVAAELTMFAKDRRVLAVGDSSVVSEFIKKGSLDFVFYDPEHGYEAMKKGLPVWHSKIQQRGLFCGHDYNGRSDKSGRFGVKRAVDEFAKEMGCKVHEEPNLIWWMKI